MYIYTNIHTISEINNLPVKIAFIKIKMLKLCLILCYFPNRTDENNFGTTQHGCLCGGKHYFALPGDARPPVRYHVYLVFQWGPHRF